MDLKSTYCHYPGNSSSPTNPPVETSSEHAPVPPQHMSVGIVAGIAVASGIAGISIIVFLVFLYLRRRRAQQTAPESPMSENESVQISEKKLYGLDFALHSII